MTGLTGFAGLKIRFLIILLILSKNANSYTLKLSTFKTQEDSIIADLAANAPTNRHHAAGRNLGCPPGVIIALKASLHDLDSHALKRFFKRR